MPPDPKDDAELHDDDTIEQEADEGADQPDGEADSDGAEGDVSDEATDGDGGDDRTEDAEEVADGEPPARRTASEVIRDQKRGRKEATARAEAADRKADEAIKRAEAAERRAEEAERAANARRAEQSAEAEAARVELMSESERLAYYRQKDSETHRRELDGVKFQIWDSTDRADFRALKREDPLVAKVADKVEAEYERLRAQGRPVSREIIANQEIAKMVRAGRATAGKKQRERADAGVRREKVAAPRSRSDAGSDRQRRGQEDTAEARRKRLENVQL